MTMLQKLKRSIYQIDMFYSSEMLRYNSQTQYKTLTGGLFSISIVVFIIVGFASMISDTLNRTTITANLQTIKQNDPPLSILKTNQQGKFMFGLTIQSNDLGYNAELGSGLRYFDITLAIIKTENGAYGGSDYISMEQCTASHWSMLPDIAERFNSIGGSKWLCPPKDFDFPIQGIITSQTNYLVGLQVSPCINSSLFDRPCAPQSDIDLLMDTYTNFFLTINYVNPVMSPSQPDHISYYLEANDYLVFSRAVGSDAWVYFSDYTINTDNSIWPLEDNIIEKGVMVQNKAICHSFSVTNNTPYATIFFAKSLNLLIYTRVVQKVSAVLSYIGGLVGAITAVMFLIKIYTDSSLEITIGINLFNDSAKKKEQAEDKDNKKSQDEQTTFNFVKFVGLSIYQILKSFGIQKNWPTIRKLEVFQKEIVNQLDIKMLLKRIIYLELWMTYLFDQQQLQGLKYQKPISCEKARQIRELILHQKDGEDDETGKNKKIQDILVKNQGKFNNGRGQISGQNLNIPKIVLQDMISIEPQDRQKSLQNYKKMLTCKFSNKIVDKKEEQTVPVEFLNKQIKLEYPEQQSCDGNEQFDEQSIFFLKQLKKRVKKDERCEKIWLNLREDIQELVISQTEVPIKSETFNNFK